MKTLVVLGAADGALSTYRIAAEMGYRTIAVDRSAAAPGVAVADEYVPLSTRDADGIQRALAPRGDLAGVIAPCSDIALPTLLQLTRVLGLPVHLSETAVRASVDKTVLRSMLDGLGVSSYRWIASHDPREIAERARGLRFPVVVKPADAQGGRGVTRCESPEQILAAAQAAKERAYGGGILVEEEIRGTHCGCECVIEGGRVVFMAMTRRTLSPPPLTLTTAHAMPAGLPPEVERACRRLVNRVCGLLGYRRGPLNLDLVVTPGGEPYLIELGVRTGGNGIDDLTRICHGVDPVRAAVRAAVGEPIELRPHIPRPVMWKVLAAEQAGRLVSVSGAERARALPGVAELVILARPGQQVRPYREVSDKLGWVVLRGDSVAALDAAAAAVSRTLRFTVASHVLH
ncbi:ATP-grasp domain-containing protein [Acrocarpospora sp. B8E8]|uniref:ATP-grasp domain-containing protein n=1 Tax=Acrocarpospora sp. B8E8 TaxID=3153572 RepID=UPI00325E4472